MSYSYNQTTLVGRLTKDPEIRRFAENKLKCFFILAINRRYRKSETSGTTDFIPVSLWGKNAEIGNQLLRKGSPVLVSGRINVRKYEKNNEPHWMTEVIGENFQMLKNKNEGEFEITNKDIDPVEALNELEEVPIETLEEMESQPKEVSKTTKKSK